MWTSKTTVYSPPVCNAASDIIDRICHMTCGLYWREEYARRTRAVRRVLLKAFHCGVGFFIFVSLSRENLTSSFVLGNNNGCGNRCALQSLHWFCSFPQSTPSQSTLERLLESTSSSPKPYGPYRASAVTHVFSSPKACCDPRKGIG